jgi:hypothetical protein
MAGDLDLDDLLHSFRMTLALVQRSTCYLLQQPPYSMKCASVAP